MGTPCRIWNLQFQYTFWLFYLSASWRIIKISQKVLPACGRQAELHQLAPHLRPYEPAPLDMIGLVVVITGFSPNGGWYFSICSPNGSQITKSLSNPAATEAVLSLMPTQNRPKPIFWWSLQDSNLWPYRCERYALTNWAKWPISNGVKIIRSLPAGRQVTNWAKGARLKFVSIKA